VAVPEREEEAVGIVEIAIFGLMKGISGIDSAVVWLELYNSIHSN